MGKIVQLPTTEATIAVKRSDQFFAKARELSDFIAHLPLGNVDNDRLVALMVEQTNIAEHGGFIHGLDIGVAIGVNKDSIR